MFAQMHNESGVMHVKRIIQLLKTQHEIKMEFFIHVPGLTTNNATFVDCILTCALEILSLPTFSLSEFVDYTTVSL